MKETPDYPRLKADYTYDQILEGARKHHKIPEGVKDEEIFWTCSCKYYGHPVETLTYQEKCEFANQAHRCRVRATELPIYVFSYALIHYYGSKAA